MICFRDRRGSATLWVPFLAFALLVFGFAMWERSRLTIIAQGGRDAIQTAITQVCADNYKNVYTGVREGYSGGYKLANTSWTENITSSDILAKLDAKLGTSDGVKTSDGKMEYKISNLSVHVQNAPLAPTDTDGVQQFTGTATYTLTVPLAGAWSSLPPLEFSQEAKSGFSPQGEAAFGGGSDDSGSPVEGINLSESAMTLEKGDTDVVAASVVPDDAEDRKISWTSTDDNICKVSQTGAVTGVSVGSASVVALSDSGKMAQCAVTVISPVAGVSLDKTSVKLIKGASEQLNATVKPGDANNKNVRWATSDSSVCTVDSTGKIMATGAGTATVTVMTEEGGYYAECAVTVTIPVSGLTLDKTSLKMAKGAADILKATIYPSDATRPDVLWASSDSSVCTVDSTGNITAVGVGSAVISATTMDGQFEADCNVNVVIPVTGISLSPASLTLIRYTSGQLTATVSPADATDKNITWVSSNPSVCTVDGSGRVYAIGVGTATVTVRTEDGGYTATASITVKPNTYTVTANCGYGGIAYGGGVYNAGSNVTLTAQPYEHYHFLYWTNSAGTVVGYSPTYTIYNLSADTAVTANFAIDTFTVNVYGSTGGTAYGGGTYAYGTGINLQAYAYSGYHFNNWSDGAVNNPRYYTVTGSATITAVFKRNPITWTENLQTPDYEVEFGSGSRGYSWYTKYATDTSECTKCYDNMRSRRDDDGFTSVLVYTFDNPLTLPAGTTLNLSYHLYSYSDSCVGNSSIFLDGAEIERIGPIDHGVTSGFTENKSYPISNTQTIHSITVQNWVCAGGYSWTTGTLNIVIQLPDGCSFTLNGKNTSDQ